jgi:hypothetical protein
MTAPEALYLIAGTAGVATPIAGIFLWRWCAGVDKPKAEPEDDYPSHPRNDEAFAALNERAANFRRLKGWRNRQATMKRILDRELRLKRGRIGEARADFNQATSEVLRLEEACKPTEYEKWAARPENSQLNALYHDGALRNAWDNPVGTLPGGLGSITGIGTSTRNNLS